MPVAVSLDRNHVLRGTYRYIHCAPFRGHRLAAAARCPLERTTRGVQYVRADLLQRDSRARAGSREAQPCLEGEGLDPVDVPFGQHFPGRQNVRVLSEI